MKNSYLVVAALLFVSAVSGQCLVSRVALSGFGASCSSVFADAPRLGVRLDLSACEVSARIDAVGAAAVIHVFGASRLGLPLPGGCQLAVAPRFVAVTGGETGTVAVPVAGVPAGASFLTQGVALSTSGVFAVSPPLEVTLN